MLIAFGVQGLHCLTQRSDEKSLVLTRLLKDTEKGREREGSYFCLPKCGVTMPERDSKGLVRKHETVTVDRSRSTIAGGGGDVTNVSPFWEGTARKHPLPGIYLTNPLVK